MSNNTVRAMCIVEIEVESGSVWKDDVTVAQVCKQAAEGAEGRIRKLFGDASVDDKDLRSIRQGARGLRFLGIKKIVTQIIKD